MVGAMCISIKMVKLLQSKIKNIDIMEKITFILSILAILGSLFTYFYHDKKIKHQSKRLNDYQLKKFETEDIENRKAQIKGKIKKGERGQRTLIISNAGKATAHNIRLEIISEQNGIINLKFNPYEMLNPLEDTETVFFLTEGHIPILKVKYIWNDNFQNNNEFIQVLSI